MDSTPPNLLIKAPLIRSSLGGGGRDVLSQLLKPLTLSMPIFNNKYHRDNPQLVKKGAGRVPVPNTLL